MIVCAVKYVHACHAMQELWRVLLMTPQRPCADRMDPGRKWHLKQCMLMASEAVYVNGI